MAKIFKDLLDIDAGVIMSVVEFAEFLKIDGVLIACQFVPSSGKISGQSSKNFEGLHGDFATLYFKTADYVKKRGRRIPVQGEYIHLEAKGIKKRFEVLSSEDELGITALTVATYRQNFDIMKNPLQ